MFKKKMLLSMMFFVAVNPVAYAASLDKVVYSPDKGVICDKKAAMCADAYGLSVGLTESFLGRKAGSDAAKKLANISDKGVFTLSNGLHCKVNKKACYSDKYSNQIDKLSTSALFGTITISKLTQSNHKPSASASSGVIVNSDTLNQQLANFLCGNTSDIESCVNTHIGDLKGTRINKTLLTVNQDKLMLKIKAMCKNMTDDPACPKNMIDWLKK